MISTKLMKIPERLNSVNRHYVRNIYSMLLVPIQTCLQVEVRKLSWERERLHGASENRAKLK